MFRDGDILSLSFKEEGQLVFAHRSKKTWIIRDVVLNIPQLRADCSQKNDTCLEFINPSLIIIQPRQ